MPTSPGPRRRCSVPRALCITADSPSYPERHRALARQIAGEFGLEHEVIRTDEMARPEYRANPANRCYLLQARALHAPRRRSRASAASRRSPTAATPTTVATTVPGRQAAREFGVRQPARRGRSHEGRDPRAVAAGRTADVGRARIGVPVVAHSVLQRSDRRQAADDRAGRGRLARAAASASAACVITTTDRAPRDRPRRDAARARTRTWPRRSTASCARSAISTSRSTCAATASAASTTRCASAPSELGIASVARRRRRLLAVVSLAALPAPLLPPTLEDLDSVNFALGVRAVRRRAPSAPPARLPGVHRARQARDGGARARRRRDAGGRVAWRSGARSPAGVLPLLFFAFFRSAATRATTGDALDRRASSLPCSPSAARSSGSRRCGRCSDLAGLAVAFAALAACAMAALRLARGRRIASRSRRGSWPAPFWPGSRSVFDRRWPC